MKQSLRYEIMEDSEMIQTFWATSDFAVICFSVEEVKSLSKTVEDPSSESKGFAKEVFIKFDLQKKMKKSELLKLNFVEIMSLLNGN